MKKIYFATGNKQKLTRMQFLASYISQDFIIKVVPNLIEVVENGKTPIDNAKLKVNVYSNLDAPVIAWDTGLYFDDIEFDPTHIKRQALKNVWKSEEEVSQEAIFEILLDFYKNLATSKWWELAFYYIDWFVVKFPSNKIMSQKCKRENILTDLYQWEKQLYFPMSNLYKSQKTWKHYMDRTDKDMLEELSSEIKFLEKIYKTL